ncbi:MAG: SpoVR family protein [Pseudomonadota bacterium]
MDLSKLKRLAYEIGEIAKDFGLDFFPTIFEVMNYEMINQVASYGGYPTRYPHWKFGMEYESLSKSYAYGLSRIYEMVINNNPCYAYLLECNTEVDQKLVMAHVYGHCDFFKNNYWFSKTNRKMIDEMANHGTRIRRYSDRIGIEPVEDFMDKCLSIENLIDYHLPFIKRGSIQEEEEPHSSLDLDARIKKIKTKDYMDTFVNPDDFLDKQKKELVEKDKIKGKFPKESQKDILNFLMSYAPLEPWQRDILSIVREESYYFAPQGQTKIMNEGWATFWHSRIMTEKVLDDSEVIDYADHHSGTVAMNPGSINPYKIGLELFRDIKDRWDKGKFGKEYNDCDDMAQRKKWDKKLGLGIEKIFEVRKLYNDITFLDEFLTDEFCRENKFFVYAFNKRTSRYEITSRDFEKVKQQLLFSLTNFGQPIILVEDANFANRGELLLKHRHEGVDLDFKYAQDTMKNIAAIWKRPVNLATKVENKKYLIKWDGKTFSDKEVGEGV